MNFADGSAEIVAAFMRGLEPDPNLPIDQWADQYMIIPKDSGANEYGKYHSSRTPHARYIMQALSPSHPAKRVVAMVASQMFKTAVGLNFLCASIHQQPANFLWLMPTGKLAKRISRRIDKTLAAVPEVAAKVAAPRSRDALNNQDTKEFEGGALFIATAGAAANLAEVPARYVVFDEIDRAELNVDKEGSPSAMAEARQTTFEHNKKAYYPSSPTIQGESNIEKLYLPGSQQEALAQCVHCGHAQPLIFERLIEIDDGADVAYPCESCGALHTERDKTKMFAAGLWSDPKPSDGETISVTASQMFLPYGWTTWLSLYKIYKGAEVERAKGNDEPMITFYNTRLARLWKPDAEATDAKALRDRRSGYKLGVVPMGGCVLTAAADVQAHRVEIGIEAWGEGMEHWLIDYQVILGDPEDETTWQRVAEILDARYPHAGGASLRIHAAFIDSGYASQDIYNFTRRRQRKFNFAIKGASRPNKPIVSSKPTMVDINWRGNVEKAGAKLWLIGGDTAKDWLASRWKKTSGPGAMHWPDDLPRRADDDEGARDYFDGITAEFKTGKYKNGHRVTVWEKKKNEANEPLDVAQYNLAAAHYLGLHRYSPAKWQTLRESLSPATGSLFDAPASENMPNQPIAGTESAQSAIKSEAKPAAFGIDRRIGVAAFKNRGGR